ncbi:MAG: hypothetical protein ABIW76_09795 [Fibrobacteria bacterium]
MRTLKHKILLAGAGFCLTLFGCAHPKPDSRPETLGSVPRQEAENSLELMKLFEDTALTTLGLTKAQLAGSVLGTDSLLVYHVPAADLRKYGATKDFDRILINGFTVVFPVVDKTSETPITSVMVQQLKKDNKWVVTRFGNANLMRSLDVSRRALVELKGRQQGYYAVLVPALFKHFVATGTGKDMTLLPVEGLDPTRKGSRRPVPAAEAFKALAAQVDSAGALCMDTPENCKSVKKEESLPIR